MRYRIVSLGGRHLYKWRMWMSENIKSNIFEMVVPENLYQIPKRLIYLKQLLRYENIGLRRPSWKMAAKAFQGEIWDGPISRYLCNYVLYICAEYLACITKRTIHSHIGWAIKKLSVRLSSVFDWRVIDMDNISLYLSLYLYLQYSPQTA